MNLEDLPPEPGDFPRKKPSVRKFIKGKKWKKISLAPLRELAANRIKSLRELKRVWWNEQTLETERKMWMIVSGVLFVILIGMLAFWPHPPSDVEVSKKLAPILNTHLAEKLSPRDVYDALKEAKREIP